jgi:hypothetical protein
MFFVTVNAKNAIPWMANPLMHGSLVKLWREMARAAGRLLFADA